MKYIGGTIELRLKSKRSLADDMQMYRELRDVSERLVRKYDVEINIQHEPHYEPTHETFSMMDIDLCDEPCKAESEGEDE